MATIKDIAREAGVSYMTVSNVIHGRKNKVSQKTLEKINEIINKLDYKPNMFARSLVNKSSRLVAYINYAKNSSTGGFVTDPFNAIFIDALEKALRNTGYYLMLRTINDADDLSSFLQNWNIDGLFFVGLCNNLVLDVIKDTNIPIVFVDSYIKHDNIQSIGLEDFNGGFTATEHLIKNGHRNIAIAVPDLRENGVDEERFNGYKSALKKYHIPFNENFIFKNSLYDYNGITLGQQLAKNSDITAIFATADILAVEIMSGLKSCGKKVPDDISLVGFDDIEMSRLVSPMLTTIHQDTVQKGIIAAEYMINSLENEQLEKKEIILPIHLIERETVKRI